LSWEGDSQIINSPPLHIFTFPHLLISSPLIIQVAAKQADGVLGADLLEPIAGGVLVAGEVVDGAGSDHSICKVFKGKMGALLPRWL